MADSYYAGAGDAPSLADESTREEMDELLLLLEEKDADLRRAAELGKMLLDEKEADAEAHEGEKEALWRRIQDMARRVMELEQEAAAGRDEFSPQRDQAHTHSDHHEQLLAADGAGVSGFSRRVSAGGGGGGGDRAEERALRAKNEMLERQLAHMREAAEEAQLELAAARKAQFSRRSSHHRARSKRSNSILSSPAASSRLGRAERSLSGGGFSAALGPLSPAGSLSPGRFPTAASASASASAAAAAGAGGGSTCVTPTNGNQHHRRSSSRFSSGAIVSRWSVRSPRSAAGEGEGGVGGGGGDDGAESEASDDELRAADRAHGSCWRGKIEAGEDEGSDCGGDEDGGADEHDAAWLLEQNAWLMEELESKDELIEALREQLEELKQEQQWGRQGHHPSSSVQSLGNREQPADSDDDSDDDSESGQRSFLDHLLHASGGGGGGGGKPSNELAAGDSYSSTGVKEAPPRGTAVGADAFPGGAGGGLEPTAAATAGEGAPARLRRATLGVAREKRRSFGGILTENARHDDAAAEKPGAETTAGNRVQSKSPTRAGGEHRACRDGENSPVRATGDGKHQRRAFSPTRRGATSSAEQEVADSSALSPAPSGRGLPAGVVTGVVGQAGDAAAAAGAGVVPSVSSVSSSSSSGGIGGGSIKGAKSGGGHVSGQATPLGLVMAVSGKATGAAETNQTAAETQQQPQQQQQQAVSSGSPASSCAPVSLGTNPSAPAAATPRVAERETTVSGRKRAAAAAKAKAKQEAAAVAAAAEAKNQQQREASSSLAPMSRAEKKSRQAVEKLGLRAVKGVFRMTMRTTNGVVFVVKTPDVFKHPQQDTYVVFGAADTGCSGGEASARSHRVQTPATTTSTSLDPGNTASMRAAAASSSSLSSSPRPDPSAVESEAVSAGLDPADVLTIVSHAGCSPRAAIAALRDAGGDVVNAVMNLA
eukprot:g2439.t1